MAHDAPLVSVIIPTHNAEAFVGKTLISVISQSYQHLEVLVVDDGSQDRTVEIVKSIARRDERVKVLHQTNSGVAAARNLGIRESSGEFIAPIDADDIWYPEKIEKQVRCMLSAGPSTGLVYSWSLDIGATGAPLGDVCVSNIEGKVLPTLLCHNFLGNASVPLIRRVCLEELGGYDLQLGAQSAQGCEDWDLYLRVAAHYEYKVVSEFHVEYRKTFSSMSSDYRRMGRSHELIMRSAKERSPELPSILFRISRSNLYTYFARNSGLSGQQTAALFWLRQSMKASLLSTLLRLTLYQLLVSSLLGLVRRSMEKRAAEKRQGVPRLDTPDAGCEPPPQWKINLEIFRATVFHKAISLIYRLCRVR